VLVAAVGVVAITAALVICLLLRHGVDRLVFFFTTPTMEAGSGRKYTPVTGVKRYIEKLDEKNDASD
jgi:Na+/citrate or Na+/malate symporter